jgi:hypothetical protein
MGREGRVTCALQAGVQAQSIIFILLINNLNNSNTIEEYNIFEIYKEKGINNIETNGKDEVFYYIGCETMKFPEVVRANIKILRNFKKF